MQQPADPERIPAFRPRRAPLVHPRRAALLLATILMSAAGAVDAPPLQEGLWEISGRSIANPGNKSVDFKYRLCRDHAYDNAMDALVRNAPGCSTSFDDLGGGRFASASSCTVDGTTIVSKGSFTYESKAVTRSESFATYSPAYKGKTDEHVVQDQRYVGPCPSGMKPGDRITGGAARRYGG